MATYENDVILRTQDEEGNDHINYPITLDANVLVADAIVQALALTAESDPTVNLALTAIITLLDTKMATKSNVVYGANYDDYKSTGLFELQGNAENPTTNAPNGNDSNNNFYLFVMTRTSGFCTQIAISVRTDKAIYVRTCYGGTWYEWSKINDGGNAATVNGHSVNADVPANAKFTDTTVTYAAAAPKSAGTAAVGTSEKVAREDHVHPAQTDVTGNAGSADKVDTVSVTPQESTATLYPVFVDSNNSAATPEEVKSTSGLRISVLYGTVDKTGHVILALGTGVPEGTDKNVIGGLRLYTQGAGFIDLKPSAASDDNFSILLPNAAGTLALDTPASATAAGLMNTIAQTFAGAKTFNGPIYPNGATDPSTPQARKLASGSAEANDTNCPANSWYGQHV